jgi:hypothetical protein
MAATDEEEGMSGSGSIEVTGGQYREWVLQDENDYNTWNMILVPLEKCRKPRFCPECLGGPGQTTLLSCSLPSPPSTVSTIP